MKQNKKAIVSSWSRRMFEGGAEMEGKLDVYPPKRISGRDVRNEERFARRKRSGMINPERYSHDVSFCSREEEKTRFPLPARLIGPKSLRDPPVCLYQARGIIFAQPL